MTNTDALGLLRVGPREVPIPDSISPEAKAFLASATEQPAVQFPSTNVADDWREFIRKRNQQMTQTWSARAAKSGASAKMTTVGKVTIFECAPAAIRDQLSNCTLLELHGGAFVFMGGEGCKLISMVTAGRFGCRVIAVDYRMPPDHPYPAAVDDVIAVYESLRVREAQSKIVLVGSSAGGNLAAALALRARAEGLAAPDGLVLLSPQLDLTESGDSFQTLVDIDVTLKRGLGPANRLYANGHDLRHPYLSPLFGDFSRGFPPTLIQSGTRDLFLSNAARLHQILRRTGNRAELHVLEALPHGRFFGAPEDIDFANEVIKFLQSLG